MGNLLFSPVICSSPLLFLLLFSSEKQQKFSRKPFAIFGLLAENFFFFNCFSVSKSSKSHPTDSDVGVRKAESGVGRLRGFASKPSPPLALSVFRPLSRHRNQVGDRLAGKKNAGRMPYNAAVGGTINPHSRLTRKKRGRRLLVLLAPKVQEKKVCENCNLPETSRTFSVKFRKTFFPAFRWRKAAKATRPIPMPAAGRLKAASGDYPRVCKQTVPAAVAFSHPSASPPSEPSRDLPIGKGEVME
nr:hypothetical protein [uncultured Alistipes sp.]